MLFRSKLNRETGYLHLWNSLFYVKGVPVFYTPYFGFSTDTTRRTGFLMPYFSYGSTEGFHYEQPFYYAPQDNWDLEFRPQIRTNRGEGIYTTLRYVDSPYSQGSLTVGYFNEKSSFVEKEKLRNKEHKGFEFEYTRSKLVSSYFGANFQDALWVDMTILNDVDYLNLATNNIDDYTGRYVTSRLNYFLTNDSQYFGTYRSEERRVGKEC